MAYLIAQDPDRALQLFEKLRTGWPHNSAVLNALGTTHEAHRDTATALAFYRAAAGADSAFTAAADNVARLTGERLAAAPVDHAPASEGERVPVVTRRTSTRFVALIVAGTLGLFLVLTAFVAPRLTPPRRQGGGTLMEKVEAYVAAEEFVRRGLKAPATAEFPRYEDRYVQALVDGRYVVSCYVDAQNSFGAKLRTRYVVTLRRTRDDWVLEDMSLSD